MDEIRPCPFCGSNDIAIGQRELFDQLIEMYGDTVLVFGCRNCDAELNEYTFRHCNEPQDYDSMRKYLLARWNKRAGDE